MDGRSRRAHVTLRCRFLGAGPSGAAREGPPRRALFRAEPASRPRPGASRSPLRSTSELVALGRPAVAAMGRCPVGADRCGAAAGAAGCDRSPQTGRTGRHRAPAPENLTSTRHWRRRGYNHTARALSSRTDRPPMLQRARAECSVSCSTEDWGGKSRLSVLTHGT